MNEKKPPILPIITAVVAFITAAVLVITAVMAIWLVTPESKSSLIIAASMFAFPLMFICGGILLVKREYSNRSLGGAVICLITMAASALWALAVTSTGAYTSGLNQNSWDGLILIFPMMALAYILYPALIVLSIIVFIFSVKAAFAVPKADLLDSGEQSAPSKNGAIAIIVAFAVALACCLGAGSYFAAKNAHDSEELMNYLEESQAHYKAEADATFEQSVFPSRGFELENYYDVKVNDIGGGYTLYYRSKKTGLDWRLSEDENGKLEADLSCIFADDSKLAKLELDEFVLVEKDGNYLGAWYSACHGTKQLKDNQIAAIIDRIDKDVLDSYTIDRVYNIATGAEKYTELPPQIK